MVLGAFAVLVAVLIISGLQDGGNGSGTDIWGTWITNKTPADNPTVSNHRLTINEITHNQDDGTSYGEAVWYRIYSGGAEVGSGQLDSTGTKTLTLDEGNYTVKVLVGRDGLPNFYYGTDSRSQDVNLNSDKTLAFEFWYTTPIYVSIFGGGN